MDPATQFPPGYLAEDRSQQLLNVAIVFGVLETVFIVLFFTARVISKTAKGVDIYLMLLAYLACFSHVILIPLFVAYGGAGRHVVAVTPKELEIWLKLIFAEEFLYLFSATIPKLAILCLYLRIFATRPYRYATYGIAGVMILNYIVDVIIALIMCKPIAFSWDKAIPGGRCGDIMAAYRWISVPNLVTDVAILILPLPMIWGLHAKLSQKIGLTLTFVTASFGIVTSGLRFATFFQTNLFSDPTYLVVETMTWTCVEPGVYFIAATMPSLRPLLRLIFNKVDLNTLRNRLQGMSVRAVWTRLRSDVSSSIGKETPDGSSMTPSNRGGFTKSRE